MFNLRSTLEPGLEARGRQFLNAFIAGDGLYPECVSNGIRRVFRSVLYVSMLVTIPALSLPGMRQIFIG